MVIGRGTAGSTSTQGGNGWGTRQAETTLTGMFVGQFTASIVLKPSTAWPGGVPEVQTEGIHQPSESGRSQGFTSRQHYPKPGVGQPYPATTHWSHQRFSCKFRSLFRFKVLIHRVGPPWEPRDDSREVRRCCHDSGECAQQSCGGHCRTSTSVY